MGDHRSPERIRANEDIRALYFAFFRPSLTLFRGGPKGSQIEFPNTLEMFYICRAQGQSLLHGRCGD